MAPSGLKKFRTSAIARLAQEMRGVGGDADSSRPGVRWSSEVTKLAFVFGVGEKN